ncbi:hypothetical protein BC830DRAFT_1082054 [Chytriomyces sp. MP71]|nr:hypothetical protein BC830DRAFT_1082054 [Chytriomyces sp. MP71]
MQSITPYILGPFALLPLRLSPLLIQLNFHFQQQLLKKDRVAKHKLAELDSTLSKEELEAKCRQIIGDSHNVKNNPRKGGCPVSVETLALASWLDKIGASLREKLGNGAAILDAGAIVFWNTDESDRVGGTHSELTHELVFRKLLTGTICTNSGINLVDDDEVGTDQSVEIPEEVDEKYRADVAKVDQLVDLVERFYLMFLVKKAMEGGSTEFFGFTLFSKVCPIAHIDREAMAE